MNNPHFIFGGASITDSPWLTWKDFVIERYNIRDVDCCAVKGVGNEFIRWSVLNKIKPNSVACLMFTNIDKWDWMVNDVETAEKINREEKHKVINLDGQESDQGFWCTGSWFPVYKEHYKKNYYNQTYMLGKTLECICFLQTFFEQRKIPYLLLFDSPILQITEQELNQGIIQESLLLESKNPLIKFWYDLIDWSNIYQPGLIGYCDQNNLPWRNKKFGGHPPSSSHLNFCNQHVFPFLDQYATVQQTDLEWMAKKFDQMWQET